MAMSGQTSAHELQLVHLSWSVHCAGLKPRAFNRSLMIRIFTGQTLTHRPQLLHCCSSIETLSKV